ncbi:MAG: ATP-dependent DNA helicase [Pseudomonadota bacterium]
MGLNYVVAVRVLCDFSARQGDLDLRFTPSPTAQEGIAGHALVTGRRGPNYQAEVSLSGQHGPLQVRGRADGYDPDQNLLEEIKTYRGELASMPANHRHLHWAQLRVYGHLLCQKLNLDQVNLALVYFDIASQAETVLREQHSASALAVMFADLCQRFVAWAEQEIAHRQARDACLTTLRFPHTDFRPGQRDLATTIFKANDSARCVMAQAPTGIGKTVGTLFPALKAAPRQNLDKVFYLAAKTPGRKLALDAAANIKNSAPLLPLRVLELAARDKACEHPDKACHGDSCPLAKGFYDRLPAARSAALEGGTLDRDALCSVALAHDVCPYYLGSEMAKWSDLIIGDYNYYFDLGGMLHGLTLANQWKVSVLVDEAHNLVARARQMYSAGLDRIALRAARAVAPAALKTALGRVARNWPKLDAAYQVLPAPPAKLLDALAGASSAITDFVGANPGPMEPALQRFYFDAMHFARLAELFGEHSLFDAEDQALCIRNIVPAPFLKPRFELAHSTSLFSATLSPWHYYSDALGLPPDTAWVDIASPFAAEQLKVHVVEHISTRFRHRANSAAPIARLIAGQYRETPGNYLAFFSSFDYLEQVAAEFMRQFPEVPCWQQPRRMAESERDQFLARFTTSSQGVGFAVLGGAFGEGIDLPGARLIGAFVATLGLPAVNPVNEQIRQRLGYDYTYLYPGIQKVVQAAGRVIRTETDRGVVYLIDDRFAQAEVQQLLPRWWNPVSRSSP